MSYSLLKMQEMLRIIPMDGVKSVAAGNHGPAHQILGMDEIRRRDLVAKEAEAEAAEDGAQEPPMIDQYMQMAEMIGAPQRMPQGMDFPGNNIQPQAPAQIQQSMQPQNMANMMASQESPVPPAEMRYNEGRSVNPLKTLSEIGSPLLASQKVKEDKMKKAMKFADKLGISVEEAMEIIEAQSMSSPGPGIGYNEGGSVGVLEKAKSLSKRMNISLGEAIEYLEDLKNNAKLGYGGEYFSGDFDDSRSALKKYTSADEEGSLEAFKNYEDAVRAEAISLGYATPESFPGSSRRQRDNRAAFNKPLPIQELMKFIQDRNEREQGLAELGPKTPIDQTMYSFKTGGPIGTHQMPDGTVMPGRTHEEAVQMGIAEEYQSGGRVGIASIGYHSGGTVHDNKHKAEASGMLLPGSWTEEELAAHRGGKRARANGTTRKVSDRTPSIIDVLSGDPGSAYVSDTFSPGRDRIDTRPEYPEMRAQPYGLGDFVTDYVFDPTKPSNYLMMAVPGGMGIRAGSKLTMKYAPKAWPYAKQAFDWPFRKLGQLAKGQKVNKAGKLYDPKTGRLVKPADTLSTGRKVGAVGIPALATIGTNVMDEEIPETQKASETQQAQAAEVRSPEEVIFDILNKESQIPVSEEDMLNALGGSDLASEYQPQYVDDSEEQSRFDRAMASPWWALMQAGLEAASSDSPDAIKAITGGLSEGFKDYQSRLVQRENMKRAEEQQQSTEELNEARADLARANAEFYRRGGSSRISYQEFMAKVLESNEYKFAEEEDKRKLFREAQQQYALLSRGPGLAANNALTGSQLGREVFGGGV